MVQCTAVSLFRRRYKGLMRPMYLKSRVRNSVKGRTSPPCMPEMTSLMACWKLHGFDDSPCLKEITAFDTCSQEVRANPEQYKKQSEQRIPPNEINSKLSIFTTPL